MGGLQWALFGRLLLVSFRRRQSDQVGCLTLVSRGDPGEDFGAMTTEEIQEYINSAIGAGFKGFTSESGEMMTSEGGDGRFLGKVIATRYSGLADGRDLFLAIGATDKKGQIVKLGRSECLSPGKSDLNLLLRKELGIEIEDQD